MFGPLNFPATKSQISALDKCVFHCFLCDQQFDADLDIEDFMNHVLEKHNVIIKDYEQIIDLSGYVSYWKSRFQSVNMKDICAASDSDIKDSGSVSQCYILSTKIKEDSELREKLLKKSLEKALERQNFEREDGNFCRRCLFCNHDIKPTRAEYITHLSTQHNLQLGKPDNLVFIDKFISVIENKIENLKCIFCEKVFKDRPVLKEHMRKKLHKRVNPRNPIYDQFYMVNYLAPKGISKKISERKRKKSPDSDDEECDWSDWKEDSVEAMVCLFCTDSFNSWDAVLGHLLDEHCFDFKKISEGMDFYQKVKMVNYIRRQVYKNLCIICEFSSSDRSSLLTHMKEEKHFEKPKKESWDQPEFFFPTYDNDGLLCHLDASSQTSDEDEERDLVPELPKIVPSLDKPLSCLLCDKSYRTSEPLLEHMSDDHDFHYYDFTEDHNFMDRVKLLNYFKVSLSKLQCIYCNEKKDSLTDLLDHMKDLLHFMAPSKEVWCKSEYQNISEKIMKGHDTVDFLYALEDIGGMKSGQMSEQDEKGEYSDYDDDAVPIKCFFCQNESSEWSEAIEHLKKTHKYNFLDIIKGLSFYQQVQLVNYTKEQIKKSQCPVCGCSFENLLDHMNKENHCGLPPKELWDLSKYFSSNFSGDPFLSELNVLNATDGFNNVIPAKKEECADEEHSDWSDWDEEMNISIKCLFCDTNSNKWEDILNHMRDNHKFSFAEYALGLPFYDKVKMVNYIRLQVSQLKCITCNAVKESRKELLDHMSKENHFVAPPKTSWDKDMYFTPVLEFDGFLEHLDDSDSDAE